jgi:phosphonate transport system substrate-binding protein
MISFIKSGCWILGFCLSFSFSVQAQESFRLGIAPHTSARVILEMYQPLRAHLEKKLGMPVEVVTAPDFTEFAKRMLHQDYDLAVTTGHQARLAETDANYIPLLTYSAEFKAVAFVAAKGPIKSVADLKDKPILGLSPTSLVTLWGQHWMRKNGLNQPIRYVSASDSVANIVLEGQASAGFTSMANYQSLSPELQSQLRLLVESEPMAGRVYVLNSSQLSRKTTIDAALQSFAQSEEGKSYFAKYKLNGYRKLQPKELSVMDPFAAETRQSLK